jgi:hypothetical protein
MRSLLSIFNFETLNLKLPELFNWSFKIIFGSLIVIEILTRLVVPKYQIPKGHWWNHEVHGKVEQLKKIKKVDLMFTGSSLSAVNIPPEWFDDEMKKNGFNIKSFNAGIIGSDYEGISIGFEKLFLKSVRPKYVALIISPYDLDEANISVRKRTEDFIETVNMTGYQAAAIDFFSNSWFFGFRNEIREFFKTFQWKGAKPSPIGIRGYQPMYKGCTYSAEFPVTIKGDGIISKALVELVEDISRQGINIIIIEALMRSKLRKYNSNKLDAFNNILEKLKNIDRTYILDVKSIIPPDRYFIDPFHLEVEGAKIYGKDLAEQFIKQGIINN